jgi:hypothetical protein
MTHLLEEAIKKLKQMPDEEQNRFANIVLDEVSWLQAFELTKDKLDVLAEDVLKEINKGSFKKLDC